MKIEGSSFFNLNKSDALKAFMMFLFSTVVSVIGDALIQAFSTGSYSLDAIHWKEIGAAILVTVVTYLKKQFLTNSDGSLLEKEPTDILNK
jgi:uncharacterized membrane protein YeaQ/YmgE (transglycosylase-associated protein family)